MIEAFLKADVVCKVVRPKALLLVNNDVEKWVPRSQIEDEGGIRYKRDKATVLINEWFADNEGLWDEWENERVEVQI